MKVVVDDKIPFIREPLEQLADEVVYLRGADICRSDLMDADALIVRTRTMCNAQLLEGTKVTFIATATIGYDHLDTAYLDSRGISWSNCPGCNATSVGQYIKSCLLLLERERGMDLAHTTIGLVGVGHVGSAVQRALAPLGLRILLNDPPREALQAAAGQTADTFCSLRTLAEQCDIISFHTPLTRTGNHPTYHLADARFMDSLQRHPILINTSRGAVVDNEALWQALCCGKVSDAIIDTWEHEPNINLNLLHHIYIGTPHIAGYSADGKANATTMALQALCRHFNLAPSFTVTPPRLSEQGVLPPTDADDKTLALCLYNPHHDSQLLKANPGKFEEYRGNYPLRREVWD